MSSYLWYAEDENTSARMAAFTNQGKQSIPLCHWGHKIDAAVRMMASYFISDGMQHFPLFIRGS
jgi:hypothetical protein